MNGATRENPQERGRVAAVRHPLLARRGAAAEEAFRWSWRDGYDGSLEDARASRAERARPKGEAPEEGPLRTEDRP